MVPDESGGGRVSQRISLTVGAALDYARARLHRPIEIGALASRSAMSGRTFLRKFKGSVGMTPNAWLQAERMARARELLESTPMRLADVATQCGYDSPETFRRAFRRLVGVAPGAYRARFDARGANGQARNAEPAARASR